MEKDHLVDKTTQQAEQIRKSIRKFETIPSIISITHRNHEVKVGLYFRVHLRVSPGITIQVSGYFDIVIPGEI